jgi:hypothetical protein
LNKGSKVQESNIRAQNSIELFNMFNTNHKRIKLTILHLSQIHSARQHYQIFQEMSVSTVYSELIPNIMGYPHDTEFFENVE